MKDKIIIESEDCLRFDRMQLALAIRNSTYEDELSCSLLENAVINSCDGCILKSICVGIEGVVQDYFNDSTKVVSSFTNAQKGRIPLMLILVLLYSSVEKYLEQRLLRII